jgi:hypothetical protein
MDKVNDKMPFLDHLDYVSGLNDQDREIKAQPDDINRLTGTGLPRITRTCLKANKISIEKGNLVNHRHDLVNEKVGDLLTLNEKTELSENRFQSSNLAKVLLKLSEKVDKLAKKTSRLKKVEKKQVPSSETRDTDVNQGESSQKGKRYRDILPAP